MTASPDLDPDGFDPDHGELVELVTRLDAVHAEMITSDLRDLRIPAVMTHQLHEETHPDTGERGVRDTGLFQILVPAAFLEIATEVLGVTHVQNEGQATTEEIMAALEEAAPPVSFDDDTDPPSLLRRSELAGRRMGQATIAVVVAVVLTIVLRTCST